MKKKDLKKQVSPAPAELICTPLFSGQPEAIAAPATALSPSQNLRLTPTQTEPAELRLGVQADDGSVELGEPLLPWDPTQEEVLDWQRQERAGEILPPNPRMFGYSRGLYALLDGDDEGEACDDRR